jgi:cation-transporting P-type ATPase I
VWPDQAGPFLAALTDELADLPVAWVDVRLLDGVLVLALDDSHDSGVEELILAAVDAAEARVGIECNPFPEHRHGAPVEDEPILRAAAEVAADVFSVGLSVTLRALRAPRPPVEVDLDGLVALVQNVPGLRRTFARWVGRGTAEAAAGVAYSLASGALAQNIVGPVLGFAYHSLRLGELRARQEAWLAAEPRLYGPGAVSGSSSEPDGRPLPRSPGPAERFAELTWVGALGTFVATIPLIGSVERSLAVLASGAPKAARIGREAFGSHVSRDLGQRGIVVLRPGSLRLLDQIDVVVVEAGLWKGEEAARLQRVAAVNGLALVLVGAAPRRSIPDSISVVPTVDGPAEVRRLQIAGRVVATVGTPAFAPLAAGDLPIGVAGRNGRAPDGSHVICLGGLSEATRVLNACLPARQASRESAHLSLAGAVAGAVVAMAPAVGARMPRVLTAIDSAALLAVGNAVRHARHAEDFGAGLDPGRAEDLPEPIPLSALPGCDNGQEAAFA